MKEKELDCVIGINFHDGDLETKLYDIGGETIITSSRFQEIKADRGLLGDEYIEARWNLTTGALSGKRTAYKFDHSIHVPSPATSEEILRQRASAMKEHPLTGKPPGALIDLKPDVLAEAEEVGKALLTVAKMDEDGAICSAARLALNTLANPDNLVDNRQGKTSNSGRER